MNLSPSESHPRLPYTTRNGYKFELKSNIWILSRQHSINWDLMSPYVTTDLIDSLRKVLSKYAITKSASHTYAIWARFKHYAIWASSESQPISAIDAQSLANYRASLEKRDIWYVGVIAGLIRTWSKLRYAGLGGGLLQMINGWTLPGNIKGEAVQLQDPHDGALTDLEFEAFYSAVTDKFQDKKLSIGDFALVMLLAFSGRRPVQLSDLKVKDLIIARAQDGLTEYVLNVPRAKVRNSSFRGEFKPFALNSDNGAVIEALIEANAERVARLDGLDDLDLRELPLFPNWREVKKYARMTAMRRSSLPADFMHLNPTTISTRTMKIATSLSVISERTGAPMHIYPTRFRRTNGTRAARAGHGELIIAELLDHTDTQNVKIYVENVPEYVDAINEAVALQLAPIAQAFSGKLVDSEATALRGDDPSSRVRTNGGKTAGTCGHYGFCGALAPIACYTCRNFQPWLHGPHREVLDRLLSENERVARIAGQSPVSTITDRTILAVSRVIQLCDERKASIGQPNG
ncbi:hypothetical protein SAMN05428974_1514 [Sphingopyxis sp. YR583]|uniref:site-specific integrase n=1 Tax=Sphingopyxis sp. YR583 TaxID=1881047 RepID=UPI0008A7DC86|nr:site-specific integrase [Sphingopyxis sp. YR583]SEH15761.1 hypothetical protein SAMN05428974_1514 [Sphingopyxis sp. YR583]